MVGARPYKREYPHSFLGRLHPKQIHADGDFIMRFQPDNFGPDTTDKYAHTGAPNLP
jgi:hypothetical protein